MKQKLDDDELKYQYILVLAYFISHYKKYQFSEIGKLMGMTYFETKKCIDYLLEQKLLIIVEQFIIISKKGEKLLKDKGLDAFFTKSDKKVGLSEKININEIYIPIDFSLSEQYIIDDYICQKEKVKLTFIKIMFHTFIIRKIINPSFPDSKVISQLEVAQ